jgi:hypothetical protein
MISDMVTNGIPNSTNNTVTVGEIGLIRNILMGQYMQEYDERFRLLEQKILSLESDLSARIASSSKESNMQLEGLEKTFDERINATERIAGEKIIALEQHSASKVSTLEKIVLNNIADLQLKMMEMSRSDRAEFGRMLTELGQKIIKDL